MDARRRCVGEIAILCSRVVGGKEAGEDQRQMERRECQNQVEPDPAEHAARWGADLAVVDGVKGLKCSQCGSRSVDFVLTGG